MQPFRKYGKPPYAVVLVHGGPGAPGTMAAVAKKIAVHRGVIEAMQTKYNIDSLLVELWEVVTRHGHPPVTLIGHSWGAWLVILFASAYPDQVKKIILVASGPLEEKFASSVMKTRINRLDELDTAELDRLMKQIYTAPAKRKNELFLEIAEIMRKADSFQSDGTAFANIDFEYGIYESVWGEAEKLRSSGELLRHAGKLKCPVTVIHGDYDPHPYLGVKLPLEKTTKDFRFLLLEKCGHEPWSEISAKDSFYSILENEI